MQLRKQSNNQYVVTLAIIMQKLDFYWSQGIKGLNVLMPEIRNKTILKILLVLIKSNIIDWRIKTNHL